MKRSMILTVEEWEIKDLVSRLEDAKYDFNRLILNNIVPVFMDGQYAIKIEYQYLNAPQTKV